MTPSRGELLFQEPLARHTSWRVGGPAERFFLPADLDDLVIFLHSLPEDEPLFWLGLGSNLLVRDGGIKGTVICTRNRMKQLRLAGRNRVYVEAGTPCAHVARFCAEQGLVGSEFLAGIPGTLGGALAMNAGAFGGETWDLLDHVVTVDRFGALRRRNREDFMVGYRKVIGPPGEWFVSGEFILSPGDTLASREKIKNLLAKRSATQPVNWPSCGSVFRNPENDFAARLIESCGLKGYQIGAAQVSEKHANFIINIGSATATDIEAMIRHVQMTVKRETGILLQPEVQMVGELRERNWNGKTHS
jgi:UDP-N-acetylmuramate dehydrogenase